MKKILLLGDIFSNCGPSNVNKKLIDASNGKIDFVKSKNKFIRGFEKIYKVLFNDIIVFSGINYQAKLYLFLINRFHKKCIYLMHGCAKYENEINGFLNNSKSVYIERLMIESCDLILCVSEFYADWVSKIFDEYSNKISFLNNGMDLDFKISHKKYFMNNEVVIVVTGGNRVQKNNLEICNSVIKLNKLQTNITYKLYIYGYMNEGGVNYPKDENIQVGGLISQDELFSKLRIADIFILNTELESFGLSAAEALSCGCNLLISNNCGIKSIIEFDDDDVIYDVHNIDEIVCKIEKMIENPNHNKLIEKLKNVDVSWNKVYEKFLDKVESLDGGVNEKNHR